jgi:hypothetical protein
VVLVILSASFLGHTETTEPQRHRNVTARETREQALLYDAPAEGAEAQPNVLSQSNLAIRGKYPRVLRPGHQK